MLPFPAPLCLADDHTPAQNDGAELPDHSSCLVSAQLRRAHRHALDIMGYSTDIVLLVVSWRLQYKLSLRDVVEMFLERGFVFTHEAVREWEERFAPLLTEKLRAKRRGKGGRSC